MAELRILHLEDSSTDSVLVQRALQQHGIPAVIEVAASGSGYLAALDAGAPDLILSDNGLPGFSGMQALAIAKQRCPQVPFIFVSGHADDRDIMAKLDAGATDFVDKAYTWQLVSAVRRATAGPRTAADPQVPAGYASSVQRLVQAVLDLSQARSLEAVMSITRRAARELCGADGASFVLREGDLCYYADEDAIGPLWKGQRFPLSACISGWAMTHRQVAVIEDIFCDPRIPVDAYEPTFVKSLVMVPIRRTDPIGAIGNYWGQNYRAPEHDIELLQALADTTAVALENVQVYSELERRVADRTRELENVNSELEAFSYSVSHDLRSPLRAIRGYTGLLAEEFKIDEASDASLFVTHINHEAGRMAQIIEDLLRLARMSRTEIMREELDLSQLVTEVSGRMARDSAAELRIQPGLRANADRGLILVVLENLFSNALKYSGGKAAPLVEFGACETAAEEQAFFVRDNGAGFDMTHAGKLFTAFQRMHSAEEFPGTGVGLATVQRIIQRHGGRIWAEAGPGQGACFYFTLPAG